MTLADSCCEDNDKIPFTYSPCQTCEVDISSQLIPSWLLFIIVVIIIVFLLWSEFKAHDCIPGKSCTQSVPVPTEEDSELQYIDKIRDMVHNNYDFVTWRQALLAGLIASFPVIFYLKGRFPTFIEWLIATIIIFFFTYLSFSWIWCHFFYPNGLAIEENLQSLRDRIVHKCKTNKSSNISQVYNV